MHNVWPENKLTRLKATIEKLDKEPMSEWTEDEFVMYLRDIKRKNPTTIRKKLVQLRHMARHPHAPVRTHGSRTEIVVSFYQYVAYREKVENRQWGALSNDHKSIRSLGDMLGIPREVWPTCPTRIERADVEVPSPEQVYELLHADFVPNGNRSYENALLRYLLWFDFLFGVRFPSEAFAMKVQDVDADRGLVTITEPKKSGKRRRLLVEPEWLANSGKRLSLRNWLKWRAKISPTTDALFPREDGTAFPSKEALAQRIAKRVVDPNPQFHWLNPYLGRHWSVNARLIDWGFDYVRVAQWHGHESVNMTKNHYEHQARLRARVHGTNWLERACSKPSGRRSNRAEKTRAPRKGRFSDL